MIYVFMIKIAFLVVENMYRIDVKKVLNETDYEEWERLWLEADNSKVYNSTDWFKACCTAFNGKYFAAYIYKDEVLQAIIPLRSLWNLIYISPGRKYLDKSSNLFRTADPGCLDYLINEYFRTKCFIFSEVPDSELMHYGNSKYQRISSVNPFARIDSELTSISKRTRKKLDKILAENEGAFSLAVYKDNVKENIHTAFDIEQNSNKIERKRALFSNEKIRQFFADISRYPGTRLFVLYFKSIPIAHTLDFMNGHILTGCHTAYLEEYKALMPGKMLTFFVMNYCKENGIEIYDFSRGECDKKTQFAKDKSNNFSLYYGNSLFIFSIRCYFRMISILKSIKRKLRKWKIIQ